MLESEKMAIAAHLHVLLRRKVGRVTDVEWMVRNREYAMEVIRIAHAEPYPDVHEWANKLKAAVADLPPPPPSRPLVQHADLSRLGARQVPSDGNSIFPPDAAEIERIDGFASTGTPRYVGRLR